MNNAHLRALEIRIAHERARLSNARSPAERTMRAVWVAQIEREIADERALLGISDEELPEMSDDELLRSLTG